MGWQGTLALRYREEAGRTVVHDRHSGPLRVLRSLYPEGDDVCHSVLLHPPGGLVGGDTLAIDVALAAGTHALITTPGATRFYRSTGATATQSLHVRAESGSRFEWLPLESIAYDGCLAESLASFDLAPGAETIGWDVAALGLPASGLAFERGRYAQSLALSGRWLERGTTRGDDRVLLDSPLGWAGRRVLATMWFAAGSVIDAARREALLESARDAVALHALCPSAGATSPQAQVVVVRALAERVEPAMDLLLRVWSAWRPLAWRREAVVPRSWRT